uniref:Uncharacterized protein n=1 Tax=Setaria viridis TaxID=4556 RepID=A0A4U6VH57_SETVI|nr:uncharacterized protein LOC117847709 isoform X2 [Setaria viridis]TKW28005.1 hypothetical protein SEVIR_3G295666v2 [Setaria viridis]
MASGSRGSGSRGGVGRARSLFGGGGSGSASRGRGRRGGARGGRSSGPPEDAFDAYEHNVVDDAAVEVVFPTSKIKNDKAQWTERNTGLFCDLSVEQIREGNCPKGNMSTRGLKIIQEKYYMATGLKHDFQQFRNIRDQLKRLYTFGKAYRASQV